MGFGEGASRRTGACLCPRVRPGRTLRVDGDRKGAGHLARWRWGWQGWWRQEVGAWRAEAASEEEIRDSGGSLGWSMCPQGSS